MKKRFYKDGYPLGYNTRDEAEDIPFESCQSLVNARPSRGAPVPRDGIRQWTIGDYVTPRVVWALPFKTADERFLLYLGSDGGIYYTYPNTQQITIAAAGTITNPASKTWTGVRVKDSVYLFGSDGTAYIITFGNAVTCRKANIARPTIEITASSSGVGTALPAGKFIAFAATLVNRSNDAGAMSGNNPVTCQLSNVGYNPGLLESVDDFDERVYFENGTATTLDVDLLIEIHNSETLDPQVTHIRLYCSDPQTSLAGAEGAELKWFADIPARGTNATGSPDLPGPGDPYEFVFTYDEGTIAGALDVLQVLGYDGIPACKHAIYHGSRLWVGGAGTGEALGRWYYSEIPLDLEYPQKWLSMFRTATYFKDTNLENSDAGSGMGLSRNDLIFFMENSVWSLRDGDPDFEPQLIDASKGTRFPGTITQIGRDCAYLSNDGPAMIAGREVIPMEDFTAGEVWPLALGTRGYFHTLTDKTVVRGFFFRETFFIADEAKIIGMYMPGSGNGRGPWEVRPALPTIKLGHVAIFDQDTAVILSRTDTAPKLWQFLLADYHQDGGSHAYFNLDDGSNFFIRSKSKVFLFDARNPDKAGELYDIIMNASFSDAGRFGIAVSAAYFRYRWDGSYHETPATDDLSDSALDPAWRTLLKQGFPEGLVGFGFDVEWVKEFATPYDFGCAGFILRAMPVPGHPMEYVSQDLGSGPVENGPDIEFWLPFDVNEDEAEDMSLYARSHAFEGVAGFATRGFVSSMVPSGGQQLVGFMRASGFHAATWNGISALGISGMTRELVVKPAALTRDEWLEWGGDGTSFYGIKVTLLGALVLVVYTPTVKRTYTTADGILPPGGAAGTYTIQVTLSADMLTCRFYASARTAAFTALPAPTAATLPAAGADGIYAPGAAHSYYEDSFNSLDASKWSGGAVAGGRLTELATWIGSSLDIGAGDTLTISILGRLSASELFSTGNIGEYGLYFITSNGTYISAGLAVPSIVIPAPIRMNYTYDVTTVYKVLENTITTSETFDFRLTVEFTRTAIAIYLNGVMQHLYALPVPITGLYTLGIAMGVHNELAGSVDYAYLGGIPGLGTDSIGLGLIDIPTRHVILPGSSYGIAHARGLKIAKPLTRAGAFHNALKGKTA